MARILVVDDDNAVRMAIHMLLEHEGHDVVAADGGRHGLDAMKDGRFDIVICDIFMPGMDGLETIRAFHQRDPSVPVIAISGFMFRESAAGAPDFLTMATKLGAAYSLHKPFRPQDLLKAVEGCLAAAGRPGTGDTAARSQRA